MPRPLWLAAAILGSVTALALIGAAQPEPATVPGRTTRTRPALPAQTVPTTPEQAQPAPQPPAPVAPSLTHSPLTTPAQSLRYELEIDGVATSREIHASILSPITESLDVVEYRDAGDARARFRPGTRRGATFVVAGPLPMPGNMAQWYRSMLDQEPQRRNASLIIKNAANEEIQRFNVFEIWPRSMTIDPVTGSWQLEIVYEFMEQA